jgi:hypothetical protein
MDWKKEDIIKTFNNIIRDTRVLNSTELDMKYSKFKTDFEKLYNMAIDSVVNGKVQENIGKLNMMLQARENMLSGKVSKLNTDMFVGNQLGKEFIYPLTETPSNEDYKKAIDKIKKKIEETDESTELNEGDRPKGKLLNFDA